MIEIRKTETFAKWIDGLQDISARARILVRIERLSAGNPGDANSEKLPIAASPQKVQTLTYD
jgi:putative addiction module killer protein